MTELLQNLCIFAYEHRMTYTREEKLRYSDSSRMAERAYNELQALLTEHGRQRLEDYIGEENVMQNLRLDAMFRAGLSMGLELAGIK